MRSVGMPEADRGREENTKGRNYTYFTYFTYYTYLGRMYVNFY